MSFVYHRGVDKKRKEILQVIKYLLSGLSVTILQFVLVNIFPILFSSWKTALPSFLGDIFSENTMGQGNGNWGYVMTFFLSNLLANIYGYFLNRKAVFHSDSPTWCFVAFITLMATLILFSTWLQGVIASAVSSSASPFLRKMANTIAAAACGFMQNIIVYPTEKFVLLKERKKKTSVL